MKWFWKWFHLNVYTSNRIRDRSIIFLNFIDDLHEIAKRSTSTVKDWLQIATLNVRSIFQPRPDPAQDRLINLFAQSRRRPRLINSLESRDNLLKGKTYLKMCHHSLNKENDDILLIRDIFIQYQNKSRKLFATNCCMKISQNEYHTTFAWLNSCRNWFEARCTNKNAKNKDNAEG